tara:strand:+ start:11154 stop:12998 length:1845 start_codon:yes stop_codon:yes gene_type:complete
MGLVDLVVVFYEKEVDLLKVLARSIEVHCTREIVDKVFFINNSTNSVVGKDSFEKEVKPVFDKFSDRVNLIDAKDFGIDYKSGADSYTAQQALKLLFSRVTDKQFYLVLDAKNHFIRTLDYNDLFSKESKPIAHLQIHGGYLGTCLKESCNYLDVEIDLSVPTLPTVTPYLMKTSIVHDLLNEVEKREGHGIYELIDKNNKITEFLLYCAYIKFLGAIEDIYHIEGKPYATLFAKWPEKEKDVKHVLQSTNNAGVWMFSVHSKRFEQLRSSEVEFIANMWVERKLFSNIQNAKEFILSQRDKSHQNSKAGLLANTDGKVTEGRNKRLFIANDSNDVIKQHLGERLLTEQQVKTWKRLLEFRDSVCSKRGIVYQITVVPDAHSVHKDDLPILDNSSGIRPVEQIMNSLDHSTNVNYPLVELKDAKSSGEVYHPVDSHYTAYGAYICYLTIVSKLSIDLYKLDSNEIELIEKVGCGDLGDKFEPPKLATFTECVVRSHKAKKIWNNGVTNRGHMSVWVNADRSKPTCVLFTDSYGWKIQRFLAESFSKLFIVHSPLLEMDAIDEFKPDVVLTLMAERFLIYTPKDLFDKSAMELAIEKGGDIKSYKEIFDLSESVF